MPEYRMKVAPDTVAYADEESHKLVVEFAIPDAPTEKIDVKILQDSIYMAAPARDIEYVAALALSWPVKPDKAEAIYEHGLLRIEVPFKDPMEDAVKVAVKTGAKRKAKAIEAASREQRCWVHKTANVLNKMPKSVQPKAKGDLHEIWQAETKADANQAFDAFTEKYGAKYAAACECLNKDRDVLLTFYDFPAEHWSHLRTTNPIESTFATIRLRHRKTKGSGTRRASLAMMFKLAQSASKKWRRLNCHEKITLVIEGRSFKDGIMQEEIAA